MSDRTLCASQMSESLTADHYIESLPFEEHEEPGPTNECTFEASALPTKTVVVYADRAEVKRVISTHLPKGTSELLIKNVSAVIERQSVRVDGSGVMIQEVQYQEMPVDTATENEKVRQLEVEKAEVDMKRAEAEDEVASLRQRIGVLDGVAAQIASGPAPAASPLTPDSSPPPPHLMARRHSLAGSQSLSSIGASSIGFLMNEDSLSNLASFLKYYGETVGNLKTEMRGRQRECEALAERAEQLERRVDQLRCGYEYDSVKRNISIVVEMDQAGDVELFVSYQVYCASWKPAYDIRASTVGGDDAQPSTVKLCYYGLVEQNTGDDWRQAELVLSTAAPSVGGCAPQLAPLTASIHRPSRHMRQRQASSAARRKQLMTAASEEDMGFGSFDMNEIVDAAAMYRFAQRSSEESSVSQPSVDNLVSTCFSIARPVTVPSNGTEHKVLVAQTDLACAFLHDCVPSRSASAYLSAVVTNSSPHPLLPGDAAIYLNNSFVAKTHLRAIAPGDEFKCSLGVDPSVKIEYKTPTRQQEQVGFMSKSTLVTHERVVSLRNAKAAQSVRVTVREQIPKSTDDKIKIAIVCPDVRGTKAHGAEEARLTREHILEWTATLAAGQQRELAIKYTLEHPLHESVSFRAV